MTTNPWDSVLAHIRDGIGEEDFRRWFGPTSYASDSGDQITVWVPTEAIRRGLSIHFQHRIEDGLAAVGRAGTHIRFIVTGFDDDDEED